MNTKLRRKLADRKRRIQWRLDKRHNDGCEQPVLRPTNIQYELADHTRGMSHGGIGSMLLLVRRLKLPEAIDERLHLLKIHLPYHESDHVLNFAFNALCDGTCLDDIELRPTTRCISTRSAQSAFRSDDGRRLLSAVQRRCGSHAARCVQRHSPEGVGRAPKEFLDKAQD